MTHSHAFSRALCQLRVINSTFDWLTVLPVTFVIGYSDYFGFGSTTMRQSVENRSMQVITCFNFARLINGIVLVCIF